MKKNKKEKSAAEKKRIIDFIPAKNQMTLAFIGAVAIILLIAVALVVVLEYFIIQTRVFEREEIQSSGLFWILTFGSASIILGMALTPIFSKIIFKPINKLIDGMSKLSQGEYDTRVDLGKLDSMQELADGFNSLANELQGMEILRSDFVNNFSHELKTPIASISGLISLLKNEHLPLEKRKKYLEIIEEEVHRLTNMTTNILNLSKIEKQEILTDKVRFNVSEQIRSCVLLLEKKWTNKNLRLSLDFDEFYTFANEDMLKQVWFNLLDNAVKYCKKGGEIKVSIEIIDGIIKTIISNEGEPIPEDDYQKVFNKFYQVEKNGEHSREGNGIGLSIVKRIIDLHEGAVSVSCSDGVTAFIVELPTIKQ